MRAKFIFSIFFLFFLSKVVSQERPKFSWDTIQKLNELK